MLPISRVCRVNDILTRECRDITILLQKIWESRGWILKKFRFLIHSMTRNFPCTAWWEILMNKFYIMYISWKDENGYMHLISMLKAANKFWYSDIYMLIVLIIRQNLPKLRLHQHLIYKQDRWWILLHVEIWSNVACWNLKHVEIWSMLKFEANFESSSLLSIFGSVFESLRWKYVSY